MNFTLSKDTALKRHNKHWQFCVGSCHAPLAHRVDYIKHLKFISDELGIKRVRFHGLFNDDMNVGISLRDIIPLRLADKYRDISFFQIERVFNNILSIGVKPFIEIGFMPRILASGKRKCAFKYKGNITMPKSLIEWSDFIKSFIEFLIERYGSDEISSWYFEVWNEPNLPFFFKGKQKDYFRLYEATAKAIKSVDERIKVGGPSTAAGAWSEDFIKYCKENNVPYDFISTHQYPGEALGHNISIAKEVKSLLSRLFELRRKGGGRVLDGLRIFLREKSEVGNFDAELFSKNAKMLKEIIKETPLIFTEWNVTSTCSSPINDTSMAASYIVKSVMDLDGIADATSFWTFSDIFEELTFFPNPFSGSFGMLNIYGIPKPSFYAFKLLSQLGEERFDISYTKDGAEIAAFKKDDLIQLLIYTQSFSSKTDKEEIILKVELEKAPESVNVLKIDSEHCNPYKVWQEMGAPDYLKPEEVEKIKEKSALIKQSLDFDFEDKQLIIKTKNEINGVQLIEIKY